jgi:hypothetical protein
VRTDITAATLVRVGDVATSPEIYEKINPANGKGVVVLFTNFPGQVKHITSSAVHPQYTASEGVEIGFSASERATITFTASGSAAAGIVFFG